jgi:hypothetical protein
MGIALKLIGWKWIIGLMIMENEMTLIEQIQNEARLLPPEKQREALDFIAFLQQRSDLLSKSHQASGQAKRKERLKQAFASLAAWGTFADITDPLDWQRQICKDRALPGRD